MHLTPLYPCKEWWHVGALWVCDWNIFHCLNLRLFLRDRASLYELTSFLSAWLLDVYLTRAVRADRISGGRASLERARCCATVTVETARGVWIWQARGVSLSACGHILIINRCWKITDICMHPQPPLTSLCLGRFLGTIVFRITIYVHSVLVKACSFLYSWISI